MSWPLIIRTRYGWLKRRLKKHSIWDDPEFRRTYEWLQETQWWSREELEALQASRLHELVTHAYANVPYYRKKFDEIRLKPSDITTLSDLEKLPVLTKRIIRDNFDELIARNFDRQNLKLVMTGGSIGEPLSVYHSNTSGAHDAAFTLRQWSWAGYLFGDRIASLRGNLITGRAGRIHDRTWDYYTDDNTLVLQAQDLSEDNLRQYVTKLQRFRPNFIRSYPSSLEILARYVARKRIRGIHARAIFCESETLYPGQRSLIEEQFGCKIFAGYGQTERSSDATECEMHEGYHVSMEYGILEIIGADGQRIEEAGKQGKVVGTGFDTLQMPIIRYETEDLALYGKGQCSCGRESTLVGDFLGRARDFILSNSGEPVPFAPVYASMSFRSPIWGSIREVRFIQKARGELDVEVVLHSSASLAEISAGLTDSLYSWLDPKEFSIRIHIVEKVGRSRTGKRRLLQQELPIRFGDVERAASTSSHI